MAPVQVLHAVEDPKIPELLERGEFFWLKLHGCSLEQIAEMGHKFGLHPLAIEDAVFGHTRSKLEMFGDDLFMVVSTVAYVDHEQMTETSEIVATGQVMIFLGDHFVITVRRGEHAQLSALRRSLEGRRLWHHPRRRRCTLASVTSVLFHGSHPVRVIYTEPAAHLLAGALDVTGVSTERIEG